ncbi:hypothetical protein CC1G_13825 [Coprinopsis cinerea okayama7|uniref:Uncharacterized protein n=1 Tax=Coprinopsis cinerea (strain Okayama-7 / 130 / ATCC MYA-4618 / FGSC 9003) TaxID=240176 RepID=D6RKF0_COPC7|nr:hypothetical protein CC1G_13825 [Coprinopsis cinerea okayama7\|eukprot:XP_002911790.1 hypothetical protein CC1G_13825 [Coprinopsis cinerea okayama7\
MSGNSQRRRRNRHQADFSPNSPGEFSPGEPDPLISFFTAQIDPDSETEPKPADNTSSTTIESRDNMSYP